ncbi:hypothetical protein OAB00_01695 [Akkermansiaceae bacterium]|nr:hypothetical protein [Akkermansiaceae bacterium]
MMALAATLVFGITKKEDKYCSRYFVSPGQQCFEFEYDWNESEQSLIGEMRLPDGTVFKAKDQLIGPDFYIWEIIVLSATGEICVKMTGKQTRIKP